LASASSSRAIAAFVIALLFSLAAPDVRAAVYASKEAALREAFPTADRFEDRSFVLTDAQVDAIETLAQAKLERKIWTLHGAWRGNELLGWSVIDVRNVRTLPEALLVVIDPTGTVRSLRMLAFHEPSEYLPPARWLDKLNGRALTPELHLKREIHSIAGATLSSQAVTRSVRSALALYQVLLVQENAAE
jgi:Na+-translocating ferredoxin:NAD+ oxidoreductase RnfG subunit